MIMQFVKLLAECNNESDLSEKIKAIIIEESYAYLRLNAKTEYKDLS